MHPGWIPKFTVSAPAGKITEKALMKAILVSVKFSLSGSNIQRPSFHSLLLILVRVEGGGWGVGGHIETDNRALEALADMFLAKDLALYRLAAATINESYNCVLLDKSQIFALEKSILLVTCHTLHRF